MNIRYRVTLSVDERQQLEAMVQGGKGAVRKIKRAQVLLAANRGSTDADIARNVGGPRARPERGATPGRAAQARRWSGGLALRRGLLEAA